MAKIKILTDSAADIPKELAKELNITVLPITYTLDGVNYLRDGVDQSYTDFYNAIREGKMPKTAQITADRYEEAFLRELEEYDAIIALLLSAASSGSFQSANIALRDIREKREADITLIDSSSFSYVYGRVVVMAARMAAEGASKEEIISMINETMPKSKAYFVTESLDYLKAGGRINLATVFVANLLDIRPVLTIRDGLVVGADKIRGTKKICQKLAENIKEKGIDLNGKEVVIFHTCQPERVEEMKKAVEALYTPASFFPVEVGATIGSHAGPGVIGVGYIED